MSTASVIKLRTGLSAGPALVTLLLLPLLQAACSRASAAPDSALVSRHLPEVTVVIAGREPIKATIDLPANLLARNRTIVVAEVDGVIESLPKTIDTSRHSAENLSFMKAIGIDVNSRPLNLDIGDEVSKGAVLVTLRRTEFELALAAAKAAWTRARADQAHLLAWKRAEEIQQLEALRDEAAARLTRAVDDLKRAESLVADSTISQGVYDRAATEVQVQNARLSQAAAVLEAAEAGPTPEEIEIAAAQVEVAAAQVALSEERLEKTVIRAPYEGVVTDRFADLGDRVTAMPRVEILELMSLVPMVVQVSVPERLIGLVRIGNRVPVRAEGLEEAREGLVVLVNDKVDKETRTFRVRIAIDNQDRLLKAGQFARVALTVASRESSVVVPGEAVTYFGGRPCVFELRDRLVVRRDVEIGIKTRERTEIRAGLEAGASVVVDDPAVLADGMEVRIRNQAEPGK